MLYIIQQYSGELVQIQRIFISFEAILEKLFMFKIQFNFRCSVDPYLFENFVSVDGDFLKAKFRAFKEIIADFKNHF